MRYHVVLITGAGSGLGRELARQLAADGTAIAGIDRHVDGLQALAAELQAQGKRIAWAQADVTDAAGLRAQVSALEQSLGPIDLLIACAGIVMETSALDLKADDVATVIQVNLLGVAHSIAAVLPGMVERRCGHVVAISSLAALRGMPRLLAYCASKAGVNALMDGLRVEVKPHGIVTTTICPGWIRTPMTEKMKRPPPNMLTVEVAARRILSAIRRRRAFLAFPPSLAFRLRVLRWLPRGLSDWLVSRMVPPAGKSQEVGTDSSPSH